MDVRFPDMKGLENAQMRKEKREQPPMERTWVRIGITAGEIYPGDGFLDRRTKASLFHAYTPESKGHWLFTYGRMPDDEYDLEVWCLSETDPRTGKPARENINSHDVYIHREASGKVDAYIDCSRKGFTYCNMDTSLEPKAHVVVAVNFHLGMLPEWKRIRQSAHELLLSFEVKETPVGASSPLSAASASR
jgi:hypothetical protein